MSHDIEVGIYNSIVDQDGWSELEAWDPDAAADLRRADHFLELVDRSLEKRRGRLQHALGVQHLTIFTEVKGVILLAKSGLWLPILPNATAIFHVSLEAIYLARHPGKVKHFIEFSWYDAHRNENPPEVDAPYLDIAEEMFQARRKKVGLLYPIYNDKKTWHQHDVRSLATSVGLDYLLPIANSSLNLAHANPAGYMSTGKGCILMLGRRRENLTPARAVTMASILVCHSIFHFYRELLEIFHISNEMVLQAFEDLRRSLCDRDGST